MKLKTVAIAAAALALAVGMTPPRRFLFCGFFCCRFFRGCKL